MIRDLLHWGARHSSVRAGLAGLAARFPGEGYEELAAACRRGVITRGEKVFSPTPRRARTRP